MMNDECRTNTPPDHLHFPLITKPAGPAWKFSYLRHKNSFTPSQHERLRQKREWIVTSRVFREERCCGGGTCNCFASGVRGAGDHPESRKTQFEICRRTDRCHHLLVAQHAHGCREHPEILC